MMDRRLIENFDWPLIWVLLSICCIGLLSVYSALYPQIQANPTNNLFIKQVLWLLVGFTVMFCTLLVDYQQLRAISLWIYIFVILLLLLVLVAGREVNGSKRWLQLAGFQFQPSEFMKIAIVLQLSSYFSSNEISPYPSLKKLFPPAVMLMVPAVLILAEPDLGTAISVSAIACTLVLFMGIRWRYILGLVLGVLPCLWPVWEHVLKPYQKQRIMILLRPDLDPLGAGYHIRQSKIAIGSGMLWGKGFLNGTQNKLRFLPEKHTDFVFSVWAEEWGFLGCMLLLVLFALLVVIALRVARRSKDRYGSLLVVGMTSLILWQVLINIGMVIGLLPVVGITLPFVSYGGSSIITLCFAVGIIENVSMRRYTFHTR
ncbi:rod shape-determining protein RodA [Desulforhabdus sp. TSK]|uniref:rod shape-determining protein RodA n=1 Tax=Desulforhabdus sp. TSK TaxID=2925014 RepID=UPI001FC8A1B6|nr:rod shape-determining protein RodA [Desulforhabdus sp. TSK]GKT10504.1 rod shape-determining protein RodA [Desulforhabdus sp. TSK]